MTLNSSIASDIQKPSPGTLITLYKIDCTALDGPLYRFIQGTDSGQTITFNSFTYTPIDLKASGFEFKNKGQLPRPKLTISNVEGTVQGSIYLYQDLLGATVTRIRTFEKYLDGKPGADPTATFPDDLYLIEKKTSHNKNQVTWELSAYMDFEGKNLPKRQVLRDTCPWIYRIWDSGTSEFIYTVVECPYTGSNYFKKDGTVTVLPEEDVCGKRLSDCNLRYPDAALPFGNFPGVGKARK